MGWFDFMKKNGELERIISEMESNRQNNYKDAAQKDFKELVQRFEQLAEAGTLSEKQKVYYEEKIEGYREELKGYTHKDQKPFWT